MKTSGFTLIELLIVIAIISILAGVLIPQLLGARASANRKAIQMHSANVYKVFTAIQADDADVNLITLASQIESLCLSAANQITIGTVSYRYGWTTPPRAAATCTVSPDATRTNFTVTVTGDATADSKSSLNDQNAI